MFPVKLRQQLVNVHTYVVTPFREDDLYAVDYSAFASNIQFLVEQGVQVVVTGGGTGEFEAISPDEMAELARTALSVAGKKALVVATLPPNLKLAAQLARKYAAMGIEVLLGMPPLIRGQIPKNLEGTYEYFRMLAKVTELPLMPYNTQGWQLETYLRLAEIDQIIAVKDPCHDPHPMFRAIQTLGDRFVWIGNKRHHPGTVHLRYQMGMQAFTSGQSNFWPAPELAIHDAAQQQDWPRVIDLQRQCAVLEQLRMESDDAAMVKAAMDMVGLHGGLIRPPRLDCSPAALATLRMSLVSLGLVNA